MNVTTFDAPAGNFTFSRRTTGENPLLNNAIQGNALASMLLGWGGGGGYGINERPASISKYHGWYVQDDWKITRRLTLNLGFRYDFEVPRTERYDRYSWFDFDMPSPINGKVPGYELRGALRFTDKNTRSPFDKDMNNFQPRIGLAYALSAKTTVRAGYGIYYTLSQATAVGRVRPAVLYQHEHPMEPRRRLYAVRHARQPVSGRADHAFGKGRRSGDVPWVWVSTRSRGRTAISNTSSGRSPCSAPCR